MESSVIITTVFFAAAMVAGFFILKVLEKKLGLIKEQAGKEEIEGGVISKPPTSLKLDDIEYMVEWFIRRDGKIDNPLLSSMNIVENLAEETKLELDLMKAQKHKFNRYLGDLVDFLPKVDKAEMVLKEFYQSDGNNKSTEHSAEEETENSPHGHDCMESCSLGNIKSYITAKIRILGWLYYILYKKWYNQRDSEILDFTEYFYAREEEDIN